MISKICSTRMGASPMEGSSSIISLGRDIRARPMASICCSPPESVPATWRRRSFRRGKLLVDGLQAGSDLTARTGVGAHLQILLHRHLEEDLPAFGHLGKARGDDLVGRDAADLLVQEGDGAECMLKGRRWSLRWWTCPRRWRR